jgi:metal-responsive CopG/Arc/MetJ family transcriptional regulator
MAKAVPSGLVMSLRLDAAVHDSLARMAEQDGVSKSEVVRRMVMAGIEAQTWRAKSRAMYGEVPVGIPTEAVTVEPLPAQVVAEAAPWDLDSEPDPDPVPFDEGSQEVW